VKTTETMTIKGANGASAPPTQLTPPATRTFEPDPRQSNLSTSIKIPASLV